MAQCNTRAVTMHYIVDCQMKNSLKEFKGTFDQAEKKTQQTSR